MLTNGLLNLQGMRYVAAHRDLEYICDLFAVVHSAFLWQ
jgi:hypothetical protein